MAYGKRGEWLFSYAVETVLIGAQDKAAHHTDRLAWWLRESHDAEAKMRASGVEFRDQPVTGGTRVQMVIDPQLKDRVDECRNKVKEHQDHVNEYKRWERILQANKGGVVQLDVHDVEFFGL